MLDGLGAEEDLVKSGVFSDGFEQIVDSHASGQGFEIEVREDLHDQLIGDVVDVWHVEMASWTDAASETVDQEVREDGEVL